MSHVEVLRKPSANTGGDGNFDDRGADAALLLPTLPSNRWMRRRAAIKRPLPDRRLPVPIPLLLQRLLLHTSTGITRSLQL
jgi:hypothetical protein